MFMRGLAFMVFFAMIAMFLAMGGLHFMPIPVALLGGFIGGLSANQPKKYK